MSDVPVAVLDVGGTTIKLGAVLGDEVVVGQAVPTLARANAHVVLDQLRHAARQALECARRIAGTDAAHLVVAVPGPFDLAAGMPLLRGQEKFDSIYGVDLRTELRVPEPVRVAFVRDSEAVGVGEAVFGAGRGAHRVLTVALGTGFGSCLTVGGRPLHEVAGQAIDRLHELTTPHGRVDDVLSARGLAALLDVSTDRIGPVLAATELSAFHGDAVREFGRRLGSFVAEISTFGLDRVIVAGGLARSFARFHPAIREHCDVPFAAAELGVAGPLRGAAHIARHEI